MPPSQRWNRFAQSDEASLRRAQADSLARYLREELLPFSRHYRGLFERRGFDPRRSGNASGLAGLPSTTARELLRAQGLAAHRTDFLLRPTARAVKAEWSFMRKLALALGSARSQAQLARTYTPCFHTRERVDDDWLFVDHTRFDLEILGEHGARAFGFLGLEPLSDRVLSLARAGPGIEHWAFLQAGWQSGVRVAHDLELAEPALVEQYAPTAIVGPCDRVLAFLAGAQEQQLDFEALELCVLTGFGISLEDKRRAADALDALGASAPVVCRAFTSALGRALFVEPPAELAAEPGFLVSPELNLFEVVRPGTDELAAEGEGGELLLSTLTGRGTAVLRFRTGLQVGAAIDWSRCRHSGLGLPRIASDLRPLA